MASQIALVGCMMFVIGAMLLNGAAADDYVVLDSRGWTVTGNATDYVTWAAGKTFEINDVLVFNFTSKAHDVAEVNKAGFDNCNGTAPISISTTGPTNITLNSTGEHYYICTFTNHCLGGQKLAINVITDSTDTPSGTSPTPPSGSSASSLAAGGFLVTLMSIVIAFM